MSFDPNNPYALPADWDPTPPPATVPTPRISGQWRPIWDRILLILIGVTGAVGAILSVIDIETIIGSGITVVIFSSLLLARELWCRWKSRPAWPYSLTIAAAGLVFPLGGWLAIWSKNWSPGAARANYVVEAVFCFAVLTGTLAIVAVRRPPLADED